MRKTIAAFAAFALVMPVAMPISVASAQSRYEGTSKSSRNYRVVKRCRKSKGHTGLIAGGVAGALAGPSVVGGGLLGAAAGGVAGALGGRAIDRTITAKDRCSYVRVRR
jgi:outer membrane lipoprotein SlyB